MSPRFWMTDNSALRAAKKQLTVVAHVDTLLSDCPLAQDGVGGANEVRSSSASLRRSASTKNGALGPLDCRRSARLPASLKRASNRQLEISVDDKCRDGRC
jgi:hypothetical protein